VGDTGAALFDVDYSHAELSGSGSVTPNPLSQAYWRAWPGVPPGP
jgi:hypothetical protein